MPNESWIHRFIFRTLALPVGPRTERWLKGFAWIFSSTFLIRLLSGGSTLAAARLMGPAHFGEANLALASALWIQIPLLLGFPLAIQHYTPAKLPEEQAAWLRDGSWMMCATGIVTLLLCMLLSSWLSARLGVSANAFTLSLIWSAGYFVYILGTTPLIALEQFKAKAIVEVLFGLTYVSIIVYGLLHRQLGARRYIAALTIAYALAGLFAIFKTWRQVDWFERLDSRRCRLLLSYGFVAMIGSLVNALFQASGKLLVNHYSNVMDVGILSVYQSGSTQISLTLLTAAITVFFPIASRTPDHHQLWVKLRQLMWKGVVPLTALFAAALVVYLRLLGKKYPFDLNCTLVFSLAATCTLYQGLLSWYLAAGGRRRLLLSGVIGLVSGLLFCFCCRWWIPHYHTLGVGWATVVGGLSAIFFTALVANSHSDLTKTSSL